MNLNEKVEVKLTEYGKEILVKENCRFEVKDGIHIFQLWELMQIFGKYLYMGNPKVPFEENTLAISVNHDLNGKTLDVG